MAMTGDDWGRDPSVRFLRQVFRRVETDQKNLLDQLRISPVDSRLRPWRETTLRLFEKTWALAARRGLARDEKGAATLYLGCLVRTLRSEGVEVPSGTVPDDEELSRMIQEDRS